ncbi:uncharacterized protein LOC106012686 [Aplysia californica]|uniref:Uncharacterized protein LOC106012686 n=1 Tax=Aplysia californica TaxID=6500 RepID=A0ABM1A6L8_APLCA|nr:uncharacterized protein LOC106012686 [Aplysia californica]
MSPLSSLFETVGRVWTSAVSTLKTTRCDGEERTHQPAAFPKKRTLDGPEKDECDRAIQIPNGHQQVGGNGNTRRSGEERGRNTHPPGEENHTTALQSLSLSETLNACSAQHTGSYSVVERVDRFLREISKRETTTTRSSSSRKKRKRGIPGLLTQNDVAGFLKSGNSGAQIRVHRQCEVLSVAEVVLELFGVGDNEAIHGRQLTPVLRSVPGVWAGCLGGARVSVVVQITDHCHVDLEPGTYLVRDVEGKKAVVCVNFEKKLFQQASLLSLLNPSVTVKSGDFLVLKGACWVDIGRNRVVIMADHPDDIDVLPEEIVVGFSQLLAEIIRATQASQRTEEA